MSKFAAKKAPVTAPVQTTDQRIRTFEGGVGYTRDAKSELFLLAISNFVGEKTFYESAETRDTRFAQLIHQVTAEDPAFMAKFVPFLRDKANMRSASIVAAAEYVAAGGPNGRRIISAALKRPDEPAEMLAYWHLTHSRALPAAVKRGVADAVSRLYTPQSFISYDGSRANWRFGDVIDLVHPKPLTPTQSALFKYAIDTRHHDDIAVPEELETIATLRHLLALPVEQREAQLELAQAIMPWQMMTGWLEGAISAKTWEALIPNMGYMALLRNLRNFDKAEISDAAANQVIARLSDPEQVAKSRQFPYRFYSAYAAVETFRWHQALETALSLSLENIPSYKGKTLVLMDLSISMFGPTLSEHSNRQRWEVGALFALAISRRSDNATLVAYGTNSEDVSEAIRKPILRGVEEFNNSMGGTYTFEALLKHYDGHDRIVIVTDEQAHDAGRYQLPDVPIYTFNVAGYAPAQLPTANSKNFTFGGLSDASFGAIDMLERGRSIGWDNLLDV